MALDDERGLTTSLTIGPTGWKSRPHLLGVADRVIEIDWSTSLPADLLTAVRANGEHVNLLVVPPGVNATTAQAAMDLAAQSANTVPVSDLITTANHSTSPWETELPAIRNSQGQRAERPDGT